MRTAPGIDLPVSSLTDASTVPATSVCSRATSRPAIGSSTMRAWSTTSLMVAEEMSTVAASPATVIVSARSPSSSVMFTVRFWFACRVMSVRRTVLKPASSARIS